MQPAKHYITGLARTNARQPYRAFGVKAADRLSHIYIIGKTGAGKTTLLENIARQDIRHGEGLTLLDYHGDLAERVAQNIPEYRRDDVIYFDATAETPHGYNPLRRVSPNRQTLAASGLLDVFHLQWGERAWGQRMEHVLRNALLALLAQPEEMTLLDVLRLLRDDVFRKGIARNVSHKPVRNFWLYEFPNYSFRYRADAIAPIQSKVSAFLSDPRLYAILTKPKQPLSFRRIMDEGKILLINLSVGKLGSDSAGLLGGLLITSIGLAGLSRADSPECSRRRHWLFADEFQHVTTASFVGMFPQLRKYHLGLTVAHQYVNQIDEDVRYAILGNTGTLIAFRLGAHDAPFIAREFEPTFRPQDFMALSNFNIYLKLMIDGTPSRPFSATTLAALHERPRTRPTELQDSGHD